MVPASDITNSIPNSAKRYGRKREADDDCVGGCGREMPFLVLCVGDEVAVGVIFHAGGGGVLIEMGGGGFGC